MPSLLTGDDSAAADFVRLFESLGPEVAPRVALAAWDQLSTVEQAAIAADWSFWVRSKQQPPVGRWKTWGFLTGRGFGKTVAISKWIHGEVEAGRAPLICLLAQDEQNCVDLQINGPSGLIATASPQFKPVWEASALQLVWPNGARAYVRTPEVPGKIRGLEYHLTWASELQSWPTSTREEALSNVFLSTRLGAARVVWDATPKRRHPLLKELLAANAADPAAHVVVRGTTHENAQNLGDGYVAEMERKYGGTLKGREELLGEMLEDAEGALFKQAWIDKTRAERPAKLRRKVVSIDPAVSNRKGSDTTGLNETALGFDARAYVLKDASGKYEPEAWAKIVLDWYVEDDCDLVLAETNKGGQLVATNLRAAAKERGLEVIVIGKDEHPPQRVRGKVFVRELYARGAKEDRAEPVATAYERKRVSHVLGADLASLEDTMTTWEPKPNADSPGDLDALVHACTELLDLTANEPAPDAGFKGIAEVAKQVLAPPKPTNLSQVFSTTFGGGRGDRI
jgi:phage terminase large subunit-like protein